ncbi:MAG: hypothetical protein IPO07_23190 [Haliscomenobacter sp.]|nr:hypothetical protein [Haliscomenobacter sp.]MBK9491371.1 hypothetical protein [Haliscomenobacter sp.]
MEKDISILIWKYLDGECTPGEKARVQQLVLEDPSFAEEMSLAQNLQTTLQQLEPEEPSMRFTARVTEQLPALYRPIHTQAELLPKFLVRLFGGAVGTVAILSLGLFFASNQSIQGKFNILGKYTLDLGVFSNPLVFTAFLMSLGILSYFLMDFTLKKWFLKK